MSNAPIPSCCVSVVPASHAPNLPMPTYMVCNVYHGNHRSLGLCRDHISVVPLIDFHIHMERLAEGCDLQVVSVRASSSHVLKVIFENSVCFFCRRGSLINRC